MDPTTTRGRLLIKAWSTAHSIVYKLTRGRVGHGFGPNTLLLEHVGAKSGQRRTTPLFYVEDGDSVVVVASYHGAPQHPAWFHNLRANPDTEVRVGSCVRKVRARIASDVERDRLWGKAVTAYQPYDEFQQAAAQTGRTVPLVILEPR